MLRLSHALALVWLVSISLLGIISGFNLDAPFDQRTGQHVPGAKLAMSAWSGVIEPILAPFFVIAGAPDYKYAAISTMGWLFAGATIVHIAMHWSELRRRYVLLLNGVLFGIGCVLLFSLYLSVAVLIPLPSWSLAVDDPVVIVADLHSHSIPSHDAIVTPAQSRAIHRDRGFNVIGRTEHYTEKWRFALSATPRTLDESVEVIPGVEIGVVTGGRQHYFLLPGIGPSVPLESWLRRLTNHRALREFIEMIHDVEHGAVIVVSVNVNEEDVFQLTEDGVDGFEIANFGHPLIAPTVHAALVKAQRLYRVGLVADSDWHGWSGYFKTWTIIKSDSAIGGRTGETVDVLRKRDPDRIIPVVAQMFSIPSPLRVAFSPFVEAVRYGGELSPLRLGFWWVWVLLLIAAGAWLRHLGLRPVTLFMTAGLLTAGIALMLRGIQIMSLWVQDHSAYFSLHIGSLGAGIGVTALIVGCLFAKRERAQWLRGTA